MAFELHLIDWLRIIRQIRQWMSQAESLLDLPDLNDPSAVYGWCSKVLVLARESVKLTPTPVDDRIIAWLLEGPFASYESFQPYYQVFRSVLELLTSEETSEAVATRAVEFGGESASELLSNNPLGLSPIAILSLLVQVLRLILDLKGK